MNNTTNDVLIEQEIENLENNPELVEKIKQSEKEPSKPMEPEEFKKWLDEQH